MSETNVEELKEKATAFLKQLHPDLIKIKEELQSAIDRSSKELGSILTKAKQMDQLYRTYLQEAENVYYLTDQEGLAYNEIDTIYNQLREHCRQAQGIWNTIRRQKVSLLIPRHN